MTVQKILLQYEPKKENLLRVIKKIQQELKIFTAQTAQEVAAYFELKPAQVYSAASFYDQIKTQIQPPLVIQICDSSNCQLKKADQIIQEIENLFHLKAGDDHPKVKIERTSCQGRCLEGPIVIINGTIFEKMSSEKIDDILSGYL